MDFDTLGEDERVDYTGEEVSHAVPLRLGELLPGPPDGSVAGSLDAAATVKRRVSGWKILSSVSCPATCGQRLCRGRR